MNNRFRSKRVFLGILVLFVFVTLAGCAPGNNQENGSPSGGTAGKYDVKQISIGSAGTAGTFYVMASGFADVITKKLGLSTIAEVTAGSVENLKLIGMNKIDMAVSQVDVIQSALAGVEQFDKPTDVVAVLPMYPNVVQIVTLKDSPIEKFSDLKGKRVSVGSPGSGILATNTLILDAMGLSMKDIKPQYLSFNETTDAFRDGSVDAVIVNTAAPAPFLVDLETTHPLKFIPLSKEEINRFVSDYPYFVEATIPASAYKSLKVDVPTFAVWIVLTAKPDLSEDVVYDITKTIMESQEYLKDVHAVASYVNLDNVQYVQGMDFHPGAARYYQEKGLNVRSR